MNNVLEQFEITEFSLFLLLGDSAAGFIFYFLSFFSIFFSQILNWIGFCNIYCGSCLLVPLPLLIKVIISEIFSIIESLFFPTTFSTKNYVYSRYSYTVYKLFFQLKKKGKIFIFCVSVYQLIKLKIQVYFQQIIKANFGSHYPFYSRLLNYYGLFFLFFFYIVSSNYNGLFFFGFTNTSFLFQNLFFSFMAVVGLTFFGIITRSVHFYKMFVPQGVPLVLLPFLVIIELISHTAKIFSLSIRLFANMMSGHVLLHILTGFALLLAKINLLFVYLPIILITAIISLEFGIGFLQGYVLLTLLSIYFEEHFSFPAVDMVVLLKDILIHGLKIFVFFSILAYKYLSKTVKKQHFFFKTSLVSPIPNQMLLGIKKLYLIQC